MDDETYLIGVKTKNKIWKFSINLFIGEEKDFNKKIESFDNYRKYMNAKNFMVDEIVRRGGVL